jgi:hypothetical protein
MHVHGYMIPPLGTVLCSMVTLMQIKWARGFWSV